MPVGSYIVSGAGGVDATVTVNLFAIFTVAGTLQSHVLPSDAVLHRWESFKTQGPSGIVSPVSVVNNNNGTATLQFEHLVVDLDPLWIDETEPQPAVDNLLVAPCFLSIAVVL
jgi:hypothetical protein